MFISKLFTCLLCVCVCFVDCKCKRLNRLGENIKNKTLTTTLTRTNRKASRKKHKTEIQDIQPTNLREYISYIYSWRFVGWISCMSVLFVYVFLEACLFYCCLCLCVILFSPSLFKLLHLQSNKTHMISFLQKTTHKKLREKHKHRNNRNTLFPSRNLRDICSLSGRGLDILYFCCFVFLEAVMFYLCFVMFVFLLSTSLSKLLYLQSNKHI